MSGEAKAFDIVKGVNIASCAVWLLLVIVFVISFGLAVPRPTSGWDSTIDTKRLKRHICRGPFTKCAWNCEE